LRENLELCLGERCPLFCRQHTIYEWLHDSLQTLGPLPNCAWGIRESGCLGESSPESVQVFPGRYGQDTLERNQLAAPILSNGDPTISAYSPDGGAADAGESCSVIEGDPGRLGPLNRIGRHGSRSVLAHGGKYPFPRGLSTYSALRVEVGIVS
jgi:hypothetical protein